MEALTQWKGPVGWYVRLHMPWSRHRKVRVKPDMTTGKKFEAVFAENVENCMLSLESHMLPDFLQMKFESGKLNKLVLTSSCKCAL